MLSGVDSASIAYDTLFIIPYDEFLNKLCDGTLLSPPCPIDILCSWPCERLLVSFVKAT